MTHALSPGGASVMLAKFVSVARHLTGANALRILLEEQQKAAEDAERDEDAEIVRLKGQHSGSRR